jgi:hypothetical protein
MKDVAVFSLFPLKSGTEREIQEGTSWRVSWLLLAAWQEVAPKEVQRSAKQYARRQEKWPEI